MTDESLELFRDPEGSSCKPRRFVVASLAACLGLLGAVLALNVTLDPFALAGTGVVPPAVEDDRSIKLTLIEELDRSPEVLILGSSRARMAEPAFLQTLIGRTGFNAAVTGGTAADAWVMARFTADRFPNQPRRYVWFVDVGVATNGINPQLAADPRAKKYLKEAKGFRLEDVGTYIGTDATKASWRVFRKCVIRTCKRPILYLPDGSIAHGSLRYLPEQAASLERSVAELVASIRRNPPGPIKNIDPKRYVFFEQMIAWANEHGSRPVIVLNPIYPSVLQELNKYGFPMKKASMQYLRDLQRRLDFAVVDGQNIYAWGGKPIDFANATHVNWKNMRRLLEYIVARSDGALK